jgi:hypothetical protein
MPTRSPSAGSLKTDFKIVSDRQGVESSKEYGQSKADAVKFLKRAMLFSTPAERKEVEAKTVAFATALKPYLSGEYKMGNKVVPSEVRQKIADTFRELPEQVRKFLSIPNTPISDLYRGAYKTPSASAKGESVVSFTNSFNTAYNFKGTGVLKGNGEDGLLYRGSDLQSYDGIINIDSLKELRDAGLRTMFPVPIEFNEGEHIVLGAKWKPEVDTPEWKQVASKRWAEG